MALEPLAVKTAEALLSVGAKSGVSPELAAAEGGGGGTRRGLGTPGASTCGTAEDLGSAAAAVAAAAAIAASAAALAASGVACRSKLSGCIALMPYSRAGTLFVLTPSDLALLPTRF